MLDNVFSEYLDRYLFTIEVYEQYPPFRYKKLGVTILNEGAIARDGNSNSIDLSEIIQVNSADFNSSRGEVMPFMNIFNSLLNYLDSYRFKSQTPFPYLVRLTLNGKTIELLSSSQGIEFNYPDEDSPEGDFLSDVVRALNYVYYYFVKQEEYYEIALKNTDVSYPLRPETYEYPVYTESDVGRWLKYTKGIALDRSMSEESAIEFAYQYIIEQIKICADEALGESEGRKINYKILRKLVKEVCRRLFIPALDTIGTTKIQKLARNFIIFMTNQTFEQYDVKIYDKPWGKDNDPQKIIRNLLGGNNELFKDLVYAVTDAMTFAYAFNHIDEDGNEDENDGYDPNRTQPVY